MKNEHLEVGHGLFNYCQNIGLSEKYSYNIMRTYLDMATHLNVLYPQTDEVENYYTYKVNGGYSSSHLSNIVKSLRHYCGWRNINLPNIKAPRNYNGRITYLTQEEAKGLLYATENFRDYAIICLMLYSGLRRGEVCKLRLEDVDLDERLITIDSSKTHERGVAVISDKAARALKDYLKRRPKSDDTHLFLNKQGHKIHPDRISRIVKKWAGKAGLKKDVTAHVLRHTLATNLYIKTGNILLVKEQLRHKDIKSTLIYTHLDTDKKKKRLYDEAGLEF